MISIIICNEDRYTPHISNALGDANVITSESELIALSKYGIPEHVIILAELRLGNKKLSDFYGFEILCQLRAEHRLKCPIAVCSFMPEPWLRKKFPILEFPQHHPFIRLPASPETFIEKIEKAEVADESRLNDIIISYCHLKGRLIKLITHGAGFRQITRSLNVKQENDSLWSSCQDDLALLKTYLSNEALGSTILATGEKLVGKLHEAIQSRKVETLYSTKPIFDTFLGKIADAKGTSIAHLTKEE